MSNQTIEFQRVSLLLANQTVSSVSYINTQTAEAEARLGNFFKLLDFFDFNLWREAVLVGGTFILIRFFLGTDRAFVVGALYGKSLSSP
jgi:hypothetical protein